MGLIKVIYKYIGLYMLFISVLSYYKRETPSVTKKLCHPSTEQGQSTIAISMPTKNKNTKSIAFVEKKLSLRGLLTTFVEK